MSRSVAQVLRSSSGASLLVGVLLLLAVASAATMWLGYCPSCDEPTLQGIPGIRYLPLAGFLYSVLLLGSWYRAAASDSCGESDRAEGLRRFTFSTLSVVLLYGVVFLSVFATIAIRPCALCVLYWSSLAAVGIVAALARMPGSKAFGLAVAASLVAAYLILFAPFQHTVRGYMSQFVSSVGLTPGSAWPASLYMTGIDTYVVLGDCAPCNAKGGQEAIDLLARERPDRTAVLVFEPSSVNVRVPEGMRRKTLGSPSFRTLGLRLTGPPYVFQLRDRSVRSSLPASQYLALTAGRQEQ